MYQPLLFEKNESLHAEKMRVLRTSSLGKVGLKGKEIKKENHWKVKKYEIIRKIKKREKLGSDYI